MKNVLFTRLTHSVASLATAIYHHPFNQALAQGSLPLATFVFYLKQDQFYLKAFTQVLQIAEQRLEKKQQRQLFLKLAEDTEHIERATQLALLQKYRCLNDAMDPQPSLFCQQYSQYLLKIAHTATTAEMLASLSPCFWLYQQLAKNVFSHYSADHPYREWMVLYQDPHFDQSVALVIETLEEVGSQTDAMTQKKMELAFRCATHLEWQFFEGVYRLAPHSQPETTPSTSRLNK